MLYADMVNYSRLIGLDDAGTLERLRTLRSQVIEPATEEHGGRIASTGGDSFLIEFDSIDGAVRCALRVQQQVPTYDGNRPSERAIRFRIGINIGDALADGTDLHGDAVNIAARLEAQCPAGGVCVSRSVRDHLYGRLDFAFQELGFLTLKNIARPIEAFVLAQDPAVNVGAPDNEAAPVLHVSETLPLPSGGSNSLSKQLAARPPRLSLVVLPFANIGGDHDREYFADGITESLSTDLSRISGAFVISHKTAFVYKGSATDLRQIGRDLNVRYALEGSVQRGRNRLRINVQLIDCNQATHLWAERFDQTMADLFEMQDEIVARLASQLGAKLVEAEARRAERSPDPDSMDLYFRAKALINRGSTPEYLKPAEALLQRALQLDPNNVDALAAKGWVDMDFGAGFMADDRPGHLAAAEANATKALSIAPDHPLGHLVLGSFYSAVNRNDEAIAEFEHALTLDRNLVYAHALIGTAKTALGRAEEAENYYREALRLSPRDVAAHHWMSSAATSKLHVAKDEEAVSWFRRAIEANRNFAFTHLSLAAALAHLGKIDEARAAAKVGLELEPSFTIARFRAGARSKNAVYLGGRERIYEGMQQAGIPE